MELAPRPTRRRVRWIVVGILGVLLLSLGAIFTQAWISAGEVLAKGRARLASRLFPTEDFKFVRPHPMEPAEDGNAWTEFVAATAALDAIPGTDFDVLPRMSGDETPTIDDPAIAALLARMKPGFDALRKALRQRSLELKRDDPAVNSVASGLIRLARVTADGASHRHRLGDDAGALEMAGLGLMSASLTSQRGFLLDELVRVVVEQIEIPAAKEILASHDLKASDLKAFAAMVDTLPDSMSTFVQALREESWATRALILDEANDCTDRKDRWNYKILPYRLRRARCLQWMDTFMFDLDRFEALNPWDQRKASAQFKERLEKAPMIVRHWADTSLRGLTNNTINRLQRTLLRTSLAVALFEAETGAYPKSLEDLGPAYLPKSPVDSWNGKSLFYEVRSGGAVVYSAGGDGDDDGGRPVKDDTDMEEEGDIVWTVKRRGARVK